MDAEIKTAKDMPINSKNWLSTTRRIKSTLVFTVGTIQSFVDSLASNFDSKIELSVNGMIASKRICSEKIPSEYFGNNQFTKYGDTIIDTNTKMVDAIIVKRLIFP